MKMRYFCHFFPLFKETNYICTQETFLNLILMNELLTIIGQFPEIKDVESIEPLNSGWINKTYRVKTSSEETPDYILQRINHLIFTDIEMLQRNIDAATAHIRKKLEESNTEDIDRRVLTFIPSKENADKLYCVVDGQYWRIMVFIPNAITKQAVNPDSSRAAGKAFGEFQAMLADIPVSLGETIKDFHNMEFRLQQLRDVIAADPAGRVQEPQVQEMLRQIEERAEEMCKAERMGREGTLPKRVCHCDTKVNNMMFNDKDEVLCVIDLDTVMTTATSCAPVPTRWQRTSPKWTRLSLTSKSSRHLQKAI